MRRERDKFNQRARAGFRNCQETKIFFYAYLNFALIAYIANHPG